MRAAHVALTTVLASMAIFAGVAAAPAQQTYPKPTELPNPYRLVEGWPTLPKSMNNGQWGEVIRVHVAATAISGCFTAVSTRCRPATRLASIAAKPIRRSWSSIPPAS